ncbi:uncharacterized protein LOC135484530 isoform X2 [Lineus longissimus]|uniref:uncharacterized protein LOC135484530 isoform X2 n=1 Tax=Lineus longissimus TaxID=88925 RepID=UPI00315D5CB3
MDLIFGTLVLTTVFVIILNCMIFGRRRDRKIVKLKADSVDSILRFLRDSKLFPICFERGWRLHKFEHECRIWKKEPSSGSSCSHNLFAASAKVKASAQNAVKFLRDISRIMEWDPGVRSVTYLREAPEEVPKSKGPNSNNVQWDVVQEKIPDESKQWKVWWRRKLHIPIPEDFAVKNRVYYRYWNKEDNGCCWMFQFPQSKANNWVFYLAQPLEELDHCMLTIITSDGCDKTSPAQFLAPFRHFLFYRKETCSTLQTITLPRPESLESSEGKLPTPVSSGTFIAKDTNENTKEKPKESDSFLPVKKNEFSLFKRVRTMIEEKKSQIEEKRRIKNANNSSTASPKEHKTGVPNSKEQDQTEIIAQAQGLIACGPTKDHMEGFDDSPFDEIDPDSEGLTTSTPLPSSPEGKVEGKVRLRPLYRSQTVSDNMMSPNNERLQRGEDKARRHTSEKGASIGNMGDVQYKTLSNHCAAEIMAEIIKIGNLQLTDSPEEQAKSTGGWVFYGMDKEVVVLKKVCDPNFPLHCYLGKGLIKATPRTVWAAVRNPRTRFTYDEGLKKVDVIHDFGNGLKILYLYHEVNQLFKKESREFCVLQGERLEGERSILTLQSVDWLGCPDDNDVPRGQFLASGWIIEPALIDSKIYTMVTYVLQLNLGLSKTTNANLVDEIATRQPQCIALLREYLVPSAKIQETIQGFQSSAP